MLVCLPIGPLEGVKFEGSALGSVNGAYWRGELPPGRGQEHDLSHHCWDLEQERGETPPPPLLSTGVSTGRISLY